MSSGYSPAIKTFLSAKQYAVIGASTDRAKWGNKVLRWYQERDLKVTPVNPTADEVEGLQSVKEAKDLTDIPETSISIILNPTLSLPILQFLFSPSSKSSWPHGVWLQPGASDEKIEAFVKENELEERVVLGGPCVLVLGDGVLGELKGNLSKI